MNKKLKLTEEEITNLHGIKHVRWSSGDQWGRIAIKIENNFIEIKRITGNCLPVQGLLDVLVVGYGDDIFHYSEDLHQQKVNRFYWDVRQSPHGSYDFLLRIEEDREFFKFPIKQKVHISMCNKLNEGLHLYLGDLNSFFDALQEEHFFVKQNWLDNVEVVDIYDFDFINIEETQFFKKLCNNEL